MLSTDSGPDGTVAVHRCPPSPQPSPDLGRGSPRLHPYFPCRPGQNPCFPCHPRLHPWTASVSSEFRIRCQRPALTPPLSQPWERESAPTSVSSVPESVPPLHPCSESVASIRVIRAYIRGQPPCHPCSESVASLRCHRQPLPHSQLHLFAEFHHHLLPHQAGSGSHFSLRASYPHMLWRDAVRQRQP